MNVFVDVCVCLPLPIYLSIFLSVCVSPIPSFPTLFCLLPPFFLLFFIPFLSFFEAGPHVAQIIAQQEKVLTQI